MPRDEYQRLCAALTERQCRGRSGHHASARVAVGRGSVPDGKKEQRELLEQTESLLSDERRRQLSDLVRARGPIPDEILEKIAVSAAAGRSATKIAERMTELDVIDGMGGKRWTAQKINKALARYQADKAAREAV